jgi:hypothetical protein
MPSPFPGMDPYLENCGFWEDFHDTFLVTAREAIIDRLPPNYDARIESRLRVVELSAEQVQLLVGDIGVTRQPAPALAAASRPGGLLTFEPAIVSLPLQMEVRESRIQVLRLPEHSLVAVVEMLSPTNKHELGYSDYLDKRSTLLAQPVHLVEIDLLLGGHRLPMGEPLPPGDYHVIVSRCERRPKSEVYSWSVRQPLPHIPIPLRAPDTDVLLDLGELFRTVFERGRYARVLRYDAGPPAGLDDADREWVMQIPRSSR